MFVRKKLNKSGIVSVQLIDKSSGKYEMIKTIGSSDDPETIKKLVLKGKAEIISRTRQPQLNFDIDKEKAFVEMFFSGVDDLRLMGPELILGKIFGEIGFSQVKDELFRALVITRLVYPVSKLKTVDYL